MKIKPKAVKVLIGTVVVIFVILCGLKLHLSWVLRQVALEGAFERYTQVAVEKQNDQCIAIEIPLKGEDLNVEGKKYNEGDIESLNSLSPGTYRAFSFREGSAVKIIVINPELEIIFRLI